MKVIEMARDPERILIIKPSSLGDVTHALPVMALLRRRWPGAKISWLVAPVCAGLLAGQPMLDEVILFDRKRFGTAWRNPSAGMDFIRFRRDLRKREFDLVVDLQGLFRSGWMAWQTGAKVRAGFANAREFAWLFYTHRVPIGTMEQHAVERYLTIAEALGCGRGPVEFPLVRTEEARRHVEGLIPQGKGFAVLLPGANWVTKRWPIEHFAGLVAPLRERFGLESVVAGGPDVMELGRQVVGAVNLAGKTTLPQLVALLERAELVIANDSGPMHIAAALGRPLVTVFGPTNATRTGPYGREECVVRLEVECGPCYSRKCGHMKCLRGVGLETVLETAARQLGAVRRGVS